MDTGLKNIVFSKDVVEFVTVSVEYCAYLEQFSGVMQSEMTDRLSKVLPLLYIKASLLPETEMVDELGVEVTVDEETYSYIQSRLYDVYGKDDAYLEVFLEDMKYSDTPISASISEDLTDVYQDLKNFISIYEYGIVENMNDALYVCSDNFKNYWGQKLVNVLRALHSLKYSNTDAELDHYETDNTDDTW